MNITDKPHFFTETKEQREERRKFADALFSLSCIPAEVLSEEEFTKLLNAIKKPEHMRIAEADHAYDSYVGNNHPAHNQKKGDLK